LRIWAAPATMTACNPRGTRPTVHRFRLAAMTTMALERAGSRRGGRWSLPPCRSTPRSFSMADLTEQALSCSLRRDDHPDRPRYKGHRSRPLTCTFAPLAGLEPAPYGLEVSHDPSAWCCLGASPQVESGWSSNQWHHGRLRDNDRIAKGIASDGGWSLASTPGSRGLSPSDWWRGRPGVVPLRRP
jgi:hypothetical protein